MAGQIESHDCPDLAHAIDLFPTIASAVGIAVPNDLLGIDLLDSQARQARKAVFGVCNSVHNMAVGDPDSTLQYLWCVEGNWKLLVRYFGSDTTRYKAVHQWDTTPVRLYNITDDPHERKDVAADHPRVVADLKAKIALWHPVPEQNFRETPDDSVP